jgi:hypothetical protein
MLGGPAAAAAELTKSIMPRMLKSVFIILCLQAFCF